MNLPSFIKILLVNPVREGVKDGRPWSMQDAECATLSDTGEMIQVGVLPLPKNRMGEKAPVPGVYQAVYAIQVGVRDRRIGPAIVDLLPVPLKGQPLPSAAPKA